MYLGNDLGKFRQADLRREADAFRKAGETRAARAADHRAAARTVLRAAATLLLWPIKH
jgi:hypothetical protein